MQHQTTTTPEGAVKRNTLREAMEIRRVRGERFSLKEAVGITVPLCTQVATLHEEGHTFFVHPSTLDHGRAGTELAFETAGVLPTHERDRACLAPEERKGQSGDSRASVFSIGAILYELLTGEPVGPGMRRPTEAVPGLPSNLEVLLGKALVADPKHRPGDLGALAQALHQLCPSGSMPPPEADVSHLDHDVDFEVDVSLSMIPPGPSAKPPRVAPNAPASAPRMIGDGPFAVVEAAPPPASVPNLADPTVRLAALKQQLESDPRPRYVVIKDGMDHGPFNAVELLQQIASASFVGTHRVRDTISNEERMISEWEQFSLFAEQAKLNRDIKKEKRDFEAVVVAEKQRAWWKTLAGLTLIGMLAAAGVGVLMRQRYNSKHNDEVQGDKASNVDVDGGIGSGKDGKATPGGGTGHWSGGPGSFPAVAGGGSCEAAIAKYTEEYTIGGGTGKPDLGAADYGNVLNKGSYLNSCGVPSNMSVDICVAVQNGHAVGVSVHTNPSSPGVAGCISGQVRGLGFPSHPRMDVARTSFAAQ